MLYPDQELPNALKTLEARVDFLARLCATRNFGILPTAEAISEICKLEWRKAVGACQLLTSPAYHLVRD